MYGFLGKWIGLEDAINTLSSCLNARSLSSDVVEFIRYRKTNFEGTSWTQCEREGWMGCTTCLRPRGIQKLELALDIKVQISEIHAQNLWAELEQGGKIATMIWSELRRLMQYSIVPAPERFTDVQSGRFSTVESD